jgi:hypothetical protein
MSTRWLHLFGAWALTAFALAGFFLPGISGRSESATRCSRTPS